MSRVSQAEAQANRKRVVEAASRLFREKGVPNVSVADVMQSVGLTQGGFYKQFASKSALVDEAAAKAFADMLDQLTAMDDDHADHDAARSALIESYLSPEARDNPDTSCPAAGFAGDFAREPERRDVYAAGVRDMAGWIAPGDTGLAALSTLVGALLLARATAGSPLSEDILRAARKAASRLTD
ncbi:TetR/AcrR family transcriptional regulator, transcriptional repressor for nem operon [Nonomuraea maritima]|uniref:TetR/AcrR family transcriptional regulator, transcriptional repressor for nem operon n=1 Tax=Nonomuraea maritima TaxID=683260 RepID=A0A1G9QRN2_9ACTN|nr:TetR/AcrR family transcriptional regulator [Nonomuraea maritima]SDM12925.1 TetR/AcrR family transcriptional regulator, transcriptional repressor for nem operon [Nonomuraea maritima]